MAWHESHDAIDLPFLVKACNIIILGSLCALRGYVMLVNVTIESVIAACGVFHFIINPTPIWRNVVSRRTSVRRHIITPLG